MSTHNTGTFIKWSFCCCCQKSTDLGSGFGRIRGKRVLQTGGGGVYFRGLLADLVTKMIFYPSVRPDEIHSAASACMVGGQSVALPPSCVSGGGGGRGGFTIFTRSPG